MSKPPIQTLRPQRRLRAQRVQPLGMRPLVAALAAALPLLSLAQSRPAPATVPVPAASWRVNGSGAAAPVNQANGRGGVDQRIRQDSQRAIYQWQSFDIGASSSVTFDMALAGASALNRVTGSTHPSQIFGQLRATNGGEIYLINRNGILFGQGAQVNTGSLVASALNLSDAEYLSGLTQNLLYTPGTPAFRYDGDAADFIDSRNFVQVDAGARIQTDNGGRIFLFAKRVDNAGTLSSPGGQTLLAAGGEVYLKTPEQQPLYAAEDNPSVPSLRGLLVEVGSGPAGAPAGADGSVSNQASGVIETARGNTTLVGMAVNQLGRITASTSVNENGSIILRAQGRSQAGTSSVQPTAAGALVLGAGSQTEILPDDDAARHDGQPLTSDGNASFVAPRIDLAGRSVLLDTGAQVYAPGATVDVRASATPNQDLDANRSFQADADDQARIVLAEGARIDVSGMDTAVLGVDRWFVTTGLLGSNDLKDAPLQKDGLLYRSKVSVDVRDDSLILGSLDSYRQGLQQGIAERLSAGGKVRLTAGSGVFTHADSRIDVSGGEVRYTAADVRETQLIAASGQAYTLNDAPADQLYGGARNLVSGSTRQYDRWGVQVNHDNVTPTRHETGYREGRDAGTVAVVAPTLQLQGELAAGTVTGERQAQGLDALAQRGSLSLGAVRQSGNDFSSVAYQGSAVLQNLIIGEAAPGAGGTGGSVAPAADPMQASLPAASLVSQARLAAAGFGQIEVAAEGEVRLAADASGSGSPWQLGDRAELRLMSRAGDVDVARSLQSAGGQVSLLSKEAGVQLAAGQQVDLAGQFVNQWRDGLQRTDAVAGGQFSASGQTGVVLEAGSAVDVSGGATVTQAGVVQGAAAGRISLSHTAEAATARDAAHPGLVLAGQLSGQSLGAGGSLSLVAPEIRVGGSATGVDAEGVFHLANAWFKQGGFGSFSLDGRRELVLAADAQVLARRQEWLLAPLDAQAAATGSAWRQLATPGPAAGLNPAAISLSFSASGSRLDNGWLSMAEAARLDVGVGGSVALAARNRLGFDGTIEAPAGQVSLRLSATAPASASEAPDTSLWLGAHSHIDVSGVAVLQPTTNGRAEGEVRDGGSISIAARGSAGTEPVLVIQEGAELVARGASADLWRSSLTAGGVRWTQQTVDSRGGQISLEANRALVTEGSLDLHGGGSQGLGGSLSVSLLADGNSNGTAEPENALRELRVANGATRKTAGLAVGQTEAIDGLRDTASISKAVIEASGAHDLSLSARDSLRLLNGVDLDLSGTLSLNSRALVVQPGQDSRLVAGQVRLQAPVVDASLSTPHPQATAGDARLTVASRDGLLLAGDWVTQGLDRLDLQAAGDLMLQGSSAQRLSGSLHTLGDLGLQARQIYPGSGVAFEMQAEGRDLRVDGQGAASQHAAAPLTAGGQLSLQAARLTQAGVLRAPQGQISLQADESVHLLPGSLTAVSADGLWLPYGTATSDRWTAPDGTVITATPTKRIDLLAPQVQVDAGARVELQGGGELVAYEFVAGRGGSTDVFAGGNGAYALVPGVAGHAAVYDQTLAGAAALGRQITIGPGGPVPAGTYTLLPARYALQPGAFLIEPVTARTPLALGTQVTQADGSVWVGARLSTAGTGAVDALTSTWRISTVAQARRRSEIRETTANTWLAQLAQRAAIAVAERPLDAGSLTLETTQAQLSGEVDLSADADAGGRGGQAAFVAEQIQVGPVHAASGEALQLDLDTLNRLGAETLLLGARSSGTDSAGRLSLQVGAREVTIDTAGQVMQVQDLVVAAKAGVTVAAGSQIQASGPGDAQPAADYALRGDGAALRVTAAPGGELVRQAVRGQGGQLEVQSGARLQATGGLTLDATADTKIRSGVDLSAPELTLGAPALVVGAPPGGEGVLALTPALTAQMNAADQVTLHAYRFVRVKDGASLGRSDAGATTLDRLVLDTPVLLATDAVTQAAVVQAGEIVLRNSSGEALPVLREGAGQLTLAARQDAGGSGQILLADGEVAVQAAAQVQLQAQGGVRLAGRGSVLATAGDLSVSVPGVTAAVAGADARLQAGGRFDLGAALPAQLVPVSALGAALQVTAGEIQMAGAVDLPSGQVQLQATRDLQLLAGADIDVAGGPATLGGQSVALPGGSVELHSQTGQLRLTGGRVDVSATGEARAGQLTLAAPAGGIHLGTELHGQGGAAGGASLRVDSGQAIDLVALQATTQEEQAGAFDAAITLRQRSGDLAIESGQTWSAQALTLQADQGALRVDGRLDARGEDGGRIVLAAGQGVQVQGDLLASATAVAGDGGRVELHSLGGSLALAAGARVDVRGGAAGEGGQVLLRAARTAATDERPGGGVDVAPIAARLQGVSRLDVEAVKVYDGITRISDIGGGDGVLLTSQIAADGRAFVGESGAAAAALAQQLADGRVALRDVMRVHAGAEVRSQGDLDVAMDFGSWATPTERADVQLSGGDAQAVGDTSITLRAAGDLQVGASVLAGVHFSGNSSAGGSLRFAAGADLSAALSSSVQAGGVGQLDLSSTVRGNKVMRVQTTTGDIELAAAGDVRIGPDSGYRTQVASLGVPDASEATQAVRQELFLFGGFAEQAGDLRVQAGRDVLGQSSLGALAVHPNQWMVFRESLGGTLTWDAEPQRGTGFQQGLASFGGGTLTVQAGRDVQNLVAAAPGSGYLQADGAATLLGGGSVQVAAGRDVVGGVVQADGPSLSVSAGRDVAWGGSGDRPGLVLVQADTSTQVTARRDLTVGAASSSHALDGRWISGLAPDASLQLLSVGGDLVYRADREKETDANPSGETRQLWPSDVRLLAPSGALQVGADRTFGAIVQQPEQAAVRLDLLARSDLGLRADLQVNATWTQGVAYHDARGQDTDSLTGAGLPGSAWLALAYGDLVRGDGLSLDRSDRSLVQLESAEGSITVRGALRSARPVQMVAASDLRFTGTNVTSGLEVQHQPQALDGAEAQAVSELSLLQAGRDLDLGAAAIRVAGPGDLVLLAGRDVDLGRGLGVQAVGQIDNSTRLPEGSAAITVVAGLRGDGQDYTQATRSGFALLGWQGLSRRTADLFAWLSAGAPESAPLGGPAAQAFAALDTTGQLAQVRALLGPVAYEAGVVQYVRGLVGHADDSPAQALQAFATLSEVKRRGATTTLLATTLGQQATAARQAFVVQLAQADGPAPAAALQGFVQAHTGQALDLAAATAAFEQLPLAVQMLHLNAQMVAEVRSQGRAAVAARLATDKEAAYDGAYAAINALFPVDRPAGEIRLPATQVRTLQGSGIQLLAPGGGLNAGETGSTGKSASQLGVVTVAGGDIAGVARDDILVNQSRIFTLAQGDILLWSSTADVDAGRGAKTVTGAPPSVYRLDSQGRIVVDTSGSFSGSGIAVLDPRSALDLYAPAGAIDAGEAGIRAVGTVILGAEVVRGADDIQGGSVQGAPPAGASAGLAAGLAATSPNDPSAQAGGDDEDERRKRRRARRSLLLEFLGFGRG